MTQTSATPPSTKSSNTLVELSLIFLRLGTIAFGGPAAHIAMMRTEFVERREWMTQAEFLDLVGASNLIPGPSSTEVAIFIGMRRAGWVGLLLAGLCFILPASLIVTAIAWAYMRFGHLPQAVGILYGIKPVIISVIAQALWLLGRTALKTRLLFILGLVALAMGLLSVPPLAMLFGIGTFHSVYGFVRDKPQLSAKPLISLGIVVALLLVLPIMMIAFEPAQSHEIGLLPLTLVFLKLGSVVYGSGYVLLAFLRTDLVTRLHWITSGQLLDAVAVGQFTPGPVFTTATFIGYVLCGPWGAFLATVAIFVPAFAFVGLSTPLLQSIRQTPIVSSFLDGVNVAALALMAVVTWQLGRAALVDISTIAIAVLSAALLFRWRVNSAWMVLSGGVVGFLLRH